MDFNNLVIDINAGVATVTINRPEALNALNSAVLDELLEALPALEKDKQVKALILTGAGEKAFVAGADIGEMAGMTSAQALIFARRGQQVVDCLGRLRKPAIAAVNGFALGGGLEMALACDIIYASEKARVGFPEVTLGIIPGFGGTQKLGRLIGGSRASELIFTGKMLKGEEVRQWGIANAVFAAEDLLTKAAETATQIAANGPLGVACAKDALRTGADMAEADGLRYESALFAALFDSADQKEGMQAFLNKRQAQFTGA